MFLIDAHGEDFLLRSAQLLTDNSRFVAHAELEFS